MFFVLKGLSELIEEKCVFISAQSNHNNSAANPTTTTLSMYVGCVHLHISQQLWIAIVDLNKQRIPISGRDYDFCFWVLRCLFIFISDQLYMCSTINFKILLAINQLLTYHNAHQKLQYLIWSKQMIFHWKFLFW